jgi:hypothetical protein
MKRLFYSVRLTDVTFTSHIARLAPNICGSRIIRFLRFLQCAVLRQIRDDTTVGILQPSSWRRRAADAKYFDFACGFCHCHELWKRDDHMEYLVAKN